MKREKVPRINTELVKNGFMLESSASTTRSSGFAISNFKQRRCVVPRPSVWLQCQHHCNVADPEFLEKFSIFPVFSTISPDRRLCRHRAAFLQTCLEKLAKVASFSVKINNFQSFFRFFHIGGLLAPGIFQISPARNSASQVFFRRRPQFSGEKRRNFDLSSFSRMILE